MAAAKKIKKKTQAKKKSSVYAEDWPSKRNIFYRPGRMKYVRKLVKTEACVFCRSAKEEISASTLCVYKTKHSQVLLNKYPYNNGHLLILPLAHIGDLLDLSPEGFDDLHRVIRLAVQAIKAVYQPGGYNIGLNNGVAAGAGIPEHLHYHLIPRWRGDLNFFPLIAETKVVIENLEDSYDKFLDYFKALI